MTNGINNISGYGNSYSISGFSNKGTQQSKAEAETQEQVQNHEETQVDPSKVMDFLSANNFFIAPVESKSTPAVDAATAERITGYMENFEMIYGVIVDEFGEELAPDVMDVAMDYLMGMVA